MKDCINKYLVEQDIFNGFLLLSFNFDYITNEIVIIGRPSITSNIDLEKNPFIKVVFKNVENFLHTISPIVKKTVIPNNSTSFYAKEHTGTYCFNESYLKNVNNKYVIEIQMTNQLGIIRFEFNTLHIDIKYSYVKNQNNDFVYYSLGHKKLDFYNPWG